MDFPGGSDSNVSVYNAGDPGSIPGLGRFPGEGNGNPLQYSCLENPMDCTVPGVTKSRTRLSDFHSDIHMMVYPWILDSFLCYTMGPFYSFSVW